MEVDKYYVAASIRDCKSNHVALKAEERQPTELSFESLNRLLIPAARSDGLSNDCCIVSETFMVDNKPLGTIKLT